MIPLLLNPLQAPVALATTHQLPGIFIDVATAFALPKPAQPNYQSVLLPLWASQSKAANDLEARKAAEKVQADKLAAEQIAIAQTAPVQATVAYAPPVDGYKAYIYAHESGNNPTRWNSSGCLGLGQACPSSKLLAVCPSMDYACEDQFFTDYADQRYGGWAGAYAFWLSHSWW